jgi:hypothetical protein
MKNVPQRKRWSMAALFVLLVALLPSAGMAPHAAHAEDSAVDAPDAPSADASKEIVYADGAGVIRVLDVSFSGKQVQWFSPTGNWRSVALGDFDNDGDKEIAAVRGTPGSSTAPELAVFDPVVAKGAVVPGQEINGIPWKLLYTASLPARPALVFAGNFDPNVPGDEIGIVRGVIASDNPDAGDQSTVVIYKQPSATPDGTAWTVHQLRVFGENWERVAVGNLDRTGGEDVAFVDQDQGKFTVFQPDANFREVDGPGGSDARPFKDVTFGQYLRGGNQEVLAVREGNGLNSFLVFEYSSSGVSLDSDKGDKFDPGPRFIFAGDINGSNDDSEAIMLRRCDASCRRLIVRNDGSDGVIQDFLDGLVLDTDSGWRAGVAADIDGDSRDEIIIVRSDKIRWYPDAHTSSSSIDYALTTDLQNITAGDLDRNGFVSGPVFGATPGQVQTTAYFGFKTTGTIKFQNISTADVVPFTAVTNAGWLSVNPSAGSAPGATSTPLNVTYQIDATVLQPGQRYTGTVTFTGANVANSPFSVPVYVDVKLPPFGAQPAGVAALYYPCTEPLATQDLQMQIIGFPGNKFTARVLSPLAAAAVDSLHGDFFLGEVTSSGLLLTDATGAQAMLPDAAVQSAEATASAWPSDTPWVSGASSLSDSLPTTLTLTISPTLRTTDFAQTTLLLQSTDPVNPAQPIFNTHTVMLACASDASWLPIVGR